MKGLVVEACLRLRAAISAHSASKGSPLPPVLEALGLTPEEPSDIALVCNEGARREVPELEGAAAVASDVTLPSHCSGFGRFLVFGTGWTGATDIGWVVVEVTAPSIAAPAAVESGVIKGVGVAVAKEVRAGEGDVEARLTLGVTRAEWDTGTGDLFIMGPAALPRDEVDAVLKTGLAAGVSKIEAIVTATGGVLVTLLRGKTGLSEQHWLRMGVSL